MPAVTLTDISLHKHGLTDRVVDLKKAYFQAMPEVCTERAALVTRLSIERGLLGRDHISSLDKARLYRAVLERRRPVVRHEHAVGKGSQRFAVRDRSLFAGSTTSKLKGVPLYPELMALALWPELETIRTRKANPYAISENEIRILNEEVFPHWLDGNIQELGRARLAAERARAGLTGDAVEIKLLEHLVFFLTSKPNCISHTIPDFARAVGLGLRAMIDEAEGHAKCAPGNEQRDFYLALASALEGIIAYSHNLAREARRLARNEADATAKRELLELAAIHEHVPEQPARTFREGLTTVWMCWVALHLENANVGLSLGRLDQLLYPLYRKDIDSGTLDVGFAIELVCCLWLKIGDHVPTVPNAGEQLFGGSGSNQAITIGGVDADGKDAVNDLTYVLLRATELMRLRDPNLNARYHPGVSSPQYLRRLCQANLTTGATPALHNDKAVIAALTAKGDSLAQARDYGIVGCVEPGSSGRCYGHSGAILMNLVSALELTLYNGEHRHTGLGKLISERTGEVGSFHSFADVKAAFARQAGWLVDRATRLNDTFGRVHQDVYPTPILSALFEGPMDKGKDVVFGGATINASGAAIIGFADVVDSLAAIEQVVFVERAATFAELLVALTADFRGYEALRARLRNQDKTPKYGNESQQADAIARWLAELLDGLFSAKQNYRGGRYRVGYWTMTNHAGFGRLSKASPNGRRAGENFTSGITPVSGVTPYLTKTLNSVASLPSHLLSNGVALNIKYTPASDTDRMLDDFVASVEAYFDPVPGKRDGGMEIQFNVTTRDTFVDAVAHPERYPELLVRVSGYTAYFKDLNPQMQQEIIERTEYDLANGHAVHAVDSRKGATT
jgi:pyruvate formate-lyase/glycerol dehydratase family glycyl radical enzyme